jgi:hypothetical protein
VRTSLLLLAVLTAGQTPHQAGWTFGLKSAPGQVPMMVARTLAEPRSSDGTSYELILTCSLDTRRTSIASDRAVPWQTSARDARDGYIPIGVSVDGRAMQRFVLFREADQSGHVTSPMSVARAEFESPGFGEVLRRLTFGFDGQGLPVKSVVVEGLAPSPVEFRFDTLTITERARLRKGCFAMDERRLAENACKKEARTRAIQAFEAQVVEAKREWCETTRDARRQQLVDAFLRGVAAARNGGAALADAMAYFIRANPDVVMAEETGATHSCPDPHYRIDTKRLRPLLERGAPGQTTSAEVAERRLAELLKEFGVVVSTTGLTFEPRQPTMDRQAWSAAVAAAESQCTVDSGKE